MAPVVSPNVIAALGAEHVERLTGLSRRQLRDWDRVGFFAPTYAYEDRKAAYSRVYSFTDLVGLRTLSVLRKRHRIPLVELKRTALRLKLWSETPWSSLTLYVLNKEVHFHNPATGRIEGAVSGQYAAAIPLGSIMEDMRREADKLKRRSADQIGRFERHKFTLRNAWVVAGTRIPLSAIYNFADAGYGPRQIQNQYPTLKLKDIHAALEQRGQLTHAA